MIVVAGDNAASDTLMPWLGNGFRALGAATICSQMSLASIPFDKRRSGMILGAGGIGIVLESEEEQIADSHWYRLPHGDQLRSNVIFLVHYTQIAPITVSLDKEHIAQEMERFVSSVEKEQGIPRKDIALHGVYFSHRNIHVCFSYSCASRLYGHVGAGGNFRGYDLSSIQNYTGHPMEKSLLSPAILKGKWIPILAAISNI